MAEEIVRLGDAYYVLSSSERLDDRTRVLKHGDTFALFDRFGDAEEVGAGLLGVYHEDTRYLSRFGLRLEGRRPLLLSSTVRADNTSLGVDLTNPDLTRADGETIPNGTIHLFRAKTVWNGSCYERLRIRNFGRTPVSFALAVEVGADFADIFEVRGAPRAARGRRMPVEAGQGSLEFAYEGQDGRLRRTRVRFDPTPAGLEGAEARYHVRLGPHAEASYEWIVSCEPQPDEAAERAGFALADPTLPRTYDDAVARAAHVRSSTRSEHPDVATSNERFDAWWNRSVADLYMLRTQTRHGPYPYAGVPWFSTPFGRDGIVTALECLWFDPDMARGVLQYLAATQADAEDPESDAEPGKILHETRASEMCTTRELPFARYYGTIDATPLFVMLAGAYLDRTGDLAFLRSIRPNVEAALTWIDRYGDRDGDGFVEYQRRTPNGLVNQGWKDAVDSMLHEDGSLADGPIALSEVQAYVHAARLAAADLAEAMEEPNRAHELRRQAQELRERFEDAFWCEELSTYAMALDGEGRPLQVQNSNAGHCLYAGIADPGRAARVAATLTSDASFSGWGVRTIATSATGYNPMSYHNGSIWPHDNALIAAGFARYGLREEAAKVLSGLFDASQEFELHRMPELFCGFPRRQGEGPTLYPVSCSPQAWAAGAVMLLLQSCLGMEVRGRTGTVAFRDPLLPPFLDRVRIDGLRVGGASLDLMLVRHGPDVGVNVLRREGPVRVVVEK